MKKLLFLPILTLACFATLSNSWGATYNCNIQHLDAWLNDDNGNNYLYVSDWHKKNKQTFYCGHHNTDGCDINAKVLIWGNAYSDRNTGQVTKWICAKGNGGKWWQKYDDNSILECDDTSTYQKFAETAGKIYYVPSSYKWEEGNGSRWVRAKSGPLDVCYKPKNESANECTKTNAWTKEQNCPNETQFENAKTCYRGCPNGEYVYTIQLCKEGFTPKGPSTYRMGYDKCEKNAPVVPEDDDSESSFEICLKNRTTDEGRACCYLRSKVATYDSKTDKCKCKNGGTFKIDADGRGTCEASGGDGDDGRSVTPPDDDESTVQPVVTETYKCDPTKLAFITKWRIDCKDKQNIITQIEVINAHCNGLNPEKETFDTYYKMLQALNPDECAIENARKAAEEQIRAKKVQEFKSKFSTLEKIESGFGDKSVWKNKDGKFNTARLASDSIAGVVLGTAGGLITSHVVKKNQEKSGFEDIKCTVGGQEIGDFGDQMNVGIN